MSANQDGLEPVAILKTIANHQSVKMEALVLMTLMATFVIVISTTLEKIVKIMVFKDDLHFKTIIVL